MYFSRIRSGSLGISRTTISRLNFFKFLKVHLGKLCTISFTINSFNLSHEHDLRSAVPIVYPLSHSPNTLKELYTFPFYGNITTAVLNSLLELKFKRNHVEYFLVIVMCKCQVYVRYGDDTSITSDD